MKTYVTFGYGHRHKINGEIYDKDCIAVITGSSCVKNRDKAFELFGRKFCCEYCEHEFSHVDMKYYPRGLIDVKVEVTIIRMLVYKGSPDFVKRSLGQRSVKDVIAVENGSITESFLGAIPEMQVFNEIDKE